MCAKCRQSTPLEGDSWCGACTAWEALGRDLCAHWDSAGSRQIASDLVINCVRQVRALRNLGAGLSRAGSVEGAAEKPRVPAAGETRARSVAPQTTAKAASPAHIREALPRRPPPPPASVKSEISDKEEEAEESEEEESEPSPEHRQDRIDHYPKPPEPDHPPSGHRDRRHSRTSAGFDRSRDRSSRHHKHDSGTRRSDKGGRRRGGRKHQRLHRLADNPSLPVHRKPAEEYWNLTSVAQGRQAFERY